MLLPRILTAIALLAVLLPALLGPWAWAFPVFMVLTMTAGGWEWGRLNGAGQGASLASGAVVGLLAAALAWTGATSVSWSLVFTAATVVWVLGSAAVLHAGPSAWPRWPAALRWSAGVLLLLVCLAAFIEAHRVGLNFLLSVMCLVWAADIGAYFGGRRFGRRKLALAISPGKSWEGVWSGMVAVMLLALGWAQLDAHVALDSPSLYSVLFERWGVLGGLLGVLLLNTMSVVGDLVESLVKRGAGFKDSSQLLPGHGGVLDRIDALVPVLPVAMALCLQGR